jgi:iron complex outermembrane receptor protein
VEDFGNQWLTKPKFTFHNISGTVGIRKSFEKNWTTFANLSLSNRNPNPSEFFSDGLHHATGMIELGDLFLEKETSVKASITASKAYKKVYVEVSPYFNSVNNFIYLKPIGFETTIQGAFPVWEYEQTNAVLTGIDANFKWDILDNLSYNLGLAYVYGRDVTAKDYLIDMPPLTISNRLKFEKPQWNGFFMELQSEWVFTQQNFPDNNFETQIIVDGAFQTVEVDVSTPPPGYYLLNFYTEKEFNLFKKVQTRMAFTVQNILNTNYRDYLNRQRFYADDLGRNIQIQFKFNY